jgi:hypothetical protein
MIASPSAILILLVGSALAVPVEHQKRASGVPIRQDSAGGQVRQLSFVQCRVRYAAHIARFLNSALSSEQFPPMESV